MTIPGLQDGPDPVRQTVRRVGAQVEGLPRLESGDGPVHSGVMNGRTSVLLLGGASVVTLAAIVAVPLGALRLSARSVPAPALVRGLPANFAEADLVFRRRIEEAFPPGLTETALVQRLRAEGFDLRSSHLPGADRRGGHWASLTLPSSACALTWRVRWRVATGTLVSASGDYAGTCL